MTPDPYGDPDLVGLYDLDNPGGADHAYYRGLADALGARSIVDLGCGTGLLTRSLAAPGRNVTGIDPSPTMLGYARRQPGAEAVRWLDGDASRLAPSGEVDLAICTGNAIMHLDSTALGRALGTLGAALRPGGTLSFESRHPAFREWERWSRQATYGERDTPAGRLREWLEVTSVAPGRVVFDAHNVFPDGEERVYRSVLHFRTEPQLRAALAAADFTEVTVAGDWHGGPVTDDSPLLIVRAQRA